MKTSFQFLSSLVLMLLFIALVSIPQETIAQRFSHPTFNGGGAGRGAAPAQNYSRPAAPQPAYHPAPAASRPAAPQQAYHPAPAPVETRPTINGGSYNTGNHNYVQHNYSGTTASARPPANVHENAQRENVTPQRNVTVHENVNVYHNHYQPAHAYVYHPYHPYYWGHNWHPLGYFAATLAADAFLFSVGSQQYYYDDGVYYQPSAGGYSVVPAPIGATVSSLPPGYETTQVDNVYYYYYGGVFYIDTGNAYQVVQAPFGAVVTQIPDGAVQQDINGQTYLFYNNTYYQPVSQDGQDAYEVVQVN
jgi:Family of unknown function (DUF6515)